MAGLTQQDVASTTGTQADASRVAVFADVVDDDGELVIDFTDSDTINLIHRLPVIGAVTWRKGLSLPAVSLDYYGTISWYWILLIYNGFIAPDTIPSGATLNLPNVAELRRRLQQNRSGSVVTI